MTPFSEVAARLSVPLKRLGFEPLDIWDGGIGGDRHGVFDHTWISRQWDGRHLFSSLFLAWRSEANSFVAEVWAAVEVGESSPRSLVLRVISPTVEANRDVESQLQSAVVEAAARAQQMRISEVEERNLEPVYRERDPLTRAPHEETLSAVLTLFEPESPRQWRNRDVLRALVDQGFPTDRAAVNAALAELVWRGRIRRIRRGFYSG